MVNRMVRISNNKIRTIIVSDEYPLDNDLQDGFCRMPQTGNWSSSRQPHRIPDTIISISFSSHSSVESVLTRASTSPQLPPLLSGWSGSRAVLFPWQMVQFWPAAGFHRSSDDIIHLRFIFWEVEIEKESLILSYIIIMRPCCDCWPKYTPTMKMKRQKVLEALILKLLTCHSWCKWYVTCTISHGRNE